MQIANTPDRQSLSPRYPERSGPEAASGIELEGHNDVSGFLFATIGVICAVILAFLVFAVWDTCGAAERNVAQESSSPIGLYRDAEIFPAPLRDKVRLGLLKYANLVVNDEWQTQRHGDASPRARDALTAVFRVFEHARPAPSWQGAYQEALGQLNDMAAYARYGFWPANHPCRISFGCCSFLVEWRRSASASSFTWRTCIFRPWAQPSSPRSSEPRSSRSSR